MHRTHHSHASLTDRSSMVVYESFPWYSGPLFSRTTVIPLARTLLFFSLCVHHSKASNQFSIIVTDDAVTGRRIFATVKPDGVCQCGVHIRQHIGARIYTLAHTRARARKKSRNAAPELLNRKKLCRTYHVVVSPLRPIVMSRSSLYRQAARNGAIEENSGKDIDKQTNTWRQVDRDSRLLLLLLPLVSTRSAVSGGTADMDRNSGALCLSFWTPYSRFAGA